MDEKELSDYAFSYHRDYDNTKWLKIFVSLGDACGGEHEYMSGTHIQTKADFADDYGIRTHGLRFEDTFKAKTIYETHLYSGRHDDETLHGLYGDKVVVRFPSTTGFCWMEDTYGLHRGNPPLSGTRHLIAFLIGQIPVRYS